MVSDCGFSNKDLGVRIQNSEEKQSKPSSLQLLEMNARDAQRGLWNASNPIPPWELRRQRRKK
jgi:endonuclease YncB( thermonuclease family)